MNKAFKTRQYVGRLTRQVKLSLWDGVVTDAYFYDTVLTTEERKQVFNYNYEVK